MWQILCVLSAMAFGLAPVEFTPEEQEYFERFSNCRSACEVFCEYVEQGVLECHKECFLTFCYKRPHPHVPDTYVDSATANNPTTAPAPENAQPAEEPLLEVNPALLNLFADSINSFEQSSEQGAPAPVLTDDVSGEPVTDTHAGHGHGYWPASQHNKSDKIIEVEEEPEIQSWFAFFMWIGLFAVLAAGASFGIVWLVQNKHRVFGRFSRSKKFEDDVLITESYRRL